MAKRHFADELCDVIQQETKLDEQSKNSLLRRLAALKKTKVNILITGATGCGKSSTINALFDADKAKVGQGVDPETMDIAKYELDNIVLFDSPGLGDGKETDLRHARNITDKLYEKDAEGNLLIDLVLVILDGSSRDLGTSFELINNIIIPNLNGDKERLLVAINQADMAMKGRHWNTKENCPEPPLLDFLNEKVQSTVRRIFEATDMQVTPIFYAAGYKDGSNVQQPYNLSKLMLHILRHVKEEKRAVFIADINRDRKMWEHDDRLEDYSEQVKSTLWESVISGADNGAEIGREIGKVFGSAGEVVGSFAGRVIGGVLGFFSGIF
ncbi:GTPase family protein [Edwardsiella tarda]|uniref:GTPase family protein n=1 Tax=Edwardsiella tarda TaxID=636 RepID=UPI003B501BC9